MNEKTVSQNEPGIASQEKVALTIQPSKKVPGPDTLSKNSSNFVADVKNAGFIELGPADRAEISQYLPVGFTGDQLTTALSLYSRGVDSKYLEEKIDKSVSSLGLTERQGQSLYGLAYLIAAFEEYGPKRNIAFQTAFRPETTIQEVPAGITRPQENQFILQRKEGVLQPIIKEFVGAGVDFAKSKVKDFAINAIKTGGKKLAKEAVKTGAGIAAKAGVTAAVAGAEVAAGPPGWVALILQGISFVAKGVKEILSKFSEWITGEKDSRKRIMWIAAGSAAILFGLGFVVPAAAAGLVAVGAGASIAGGAAIGRGISGFGQAAIYGITHVVAPAIGVPLIIAIIIAPVLVALILFIINSGAYVTPYAPSLWTPGLVESAYIRVEKKVDKGKIANGELPEDVTYTITVSAKKSTLSNISFKNECKAIKEDSISDCTAPNPPPPSIISSVEPFEFTYINTYRSSARDSLIIDTFTVTADVAGEATGEQAASSASVCIGDCPQDCPAVWPTNTGYLTQGAYSASCCSHHNQEAIDIGSWGTPIPVYAGHAGVVRVRYNSCIGNYIEIESICLGKAFFSQYAHLEGVSVSTGQAVSMGQEIGLSGNTGTCTTGLHLHYRFRYSDMTNPSYERNNPPYMMKPYLPKDVTRHCCDDKCSSIWCPETIP